MGVVMNALAHHDRIIDNNAKYQQESEGRNHVKRDVVSGQKRERAQKSHSDTRCNPQRNFWAQG